MCFTLLSVLRKHARRELVGGRALADQEAGLDVCAQRLEDEWRLGLETSSLNSRADASPFALRVEAGEDGRAPRLLLLAVRCDGVGSGAAGAAASADVLSLGFGLIRT